MPTRLYWRDTVIGQDAYTVWALSEAMGTAATVQVSTSNTDVFEDLGAWRAEVGEDITGDTFPTSFVITARGNGTVRIRVERRASDGTVLAASAWGTERASVGTFTETFTMATAWAPGDLLAIQVQGRRAATTHGGSTVDIGVNRAGTYVDAVFSAPEPVTYDGTGSDTSASSEAGAAEVVAGPVAHDATGADASVSGEAGVADSPVVGWPAADITIGDWATPPLHEKISDASDATFITSGVAASEVLLTGVDAPGSGVVTLTVRARRAAGSVALLEARVVEGATVRATRTLTALTDVFADYVITLSGEEVASFTGWGDVRVRVTRVEP